MKNFCTLREDSPFYPLFERGQVPIKNIIVPNTVRLKDETDPVEKVEEAFMLDWSKCSIVQRANIAETACRLLGGKPGEFISYMDKGGDMPIRVSQTTGVSTEVPFFL